MSHATRLLLATVGVAVLLSVALIAQLAVG